MVGIAELKRTGRKGKTNQPASTRPAQNPALEIEQLAYRFFVNRGSEHGFDLEDWLEAEKIVRSRPA